VYFIELVGTVANRKMMTDVEQITVFLEDQFYREAEVKYKFFLSFGITWHRVLVGSNLM
jgi:hypothetical protein